MVVVVDNGCFVVVINLKKTNVFRLNQKFNFVDISVGLEGREKEERKEKVSEKTTA